ncbi:hypothetical protein CHS0354_033519 [Potamilus streckersoni]|uniref:Peptidase metallopeptidase domain-containing protein n=1 Tax=Potamilus streckersoni TaxID=2493646 RepID=A0AAE0S704_9BIVA|nr:hypothetical protein CHS0354_033519 [Potamilus streckersoni]
MVPVRRKYLPRILIKTTLFFVTFLPYIRSQQDGNAKYDGTDYLVKYGYIDVGDSHSGALLSKDYVKQAIQQFQKMAGLPVTGEMDEETRRMMQLPRCGVKDPIGTGDAARKKRYALHGSKWEKRDLTYRISHYTRQLLRDKVQEEIQKAFDIWSKVAPINFRRQDSGNVDIDVRFMSGPHGDNNPFDGQGQTLAHAYFPQYGGDAHFDDDERWTINSTQGVNLYQVAAHEFGHSLGLAHSDSRDALMAPFYRGYEKGIQLGDDDIYAIQELYGKKTDANTPNIPDFERDKVDLATTRKPIVHIPPICRDSKIDAITRTDDGLTYIFAGRHYYRLNENGIDPGYPREIAWDWEKVVGPIDAALTWPNGWTFIFKESVYWKFHNMRLIYGPKNISEGFHGIPNNIDAAFVWSGNGKTYFIKGDKYWRYYRNRIDFGYPRGDKYYRYNDQIFNVDTSGYPREIGPWWLGCPDKSQILEYDKERSNVNKDVVVSFGSMTGEGRNTDTQWINVADISDTDTLSTHDAFNCAQFLSASFVLITVLIHCIVS